MKKIIYLAFLICSYTVLSQSKIKTNAGLIVFEASVPAFEEVKAKNDAVSCVMRPNTGDIACLALVKGFRFKVALMEEHFNENYAESDTYKKAVFRGKIQDFNIKKITETATEFILIGKLEFHGKINDVQTIATVKKNAEGLEVKTNFSVLASDYGIKIPNLVKNKLTNKVNLNCEFILD